MEKQIRNLTVSIEIPAPSTAFARIHTGQSVRRHFPKGDITLLPLRYFALAPHTQGMWGRGLRGRGAHPNIAAEAHKEKSDVFQCPPSTPHPPTHTYPVTRVISQGGECQNHSSAPTHTPGGMGDGGVGLVIGRRRSFCSKKFSQHASREVRLTNVNHLGTE